MTQGRPGPRRLARRFAIHRRHDDGDNSEGEVRDRPPTLVLPGRKADPGRSRDRPRDDCDPIRVVRPPTLDDGVIVDAALEVHGRDPDAVPIDLGRSIVSGGERGGLVELHPLGGGPPLRFRWDVGAELVVQRWPDHVLRWPDRPDDDPGPGRAA